MESKNSLLLKGRNLTAKITVSLTDRNVKKTIMRLRHEISVQPISSKNGRRLPRIDKVNINWQQFKMIKLHIPEVLPNYN